MNDEVLVMDFEEFAIMHGAWRWKPGDAALHRMPGRTSERQRKLLLQRADNGWIENNARREELRKEYDQLLAEGKIRPPTRLESLLRTAKGHPDLQSTQAARRLLAKMGIEFTTDAESLVAFQSGNGV